MDDKEKEENDEIEESGEVEEIVEDDGDNEESDESENLRKMILQQLANLEQSEVSDDDSYKVRLSCILEDDESESSGAVSKDTKKASERTKENEKGPPRDEGAGARLSGLYDSETSDDLAGETVQITDLDDMESSADVTGRKRVDGEDGDGDRVDGTGSEGSDEVGKSFPIKKLKSSDNVHRRPFVPTKRREVSSDSSDLDISVTNSAEGPPNEKKVVGVPEATDDDENTLNVASDIVGVESETSLEEDAESKVRGEHDVEVLDSETLASIFAKVSKTYLEKTKGPVKWEENETIDHVYGEAAAERSRSRERQQPGDHLTLHDIHIRGTSPKQYNPPIPPETYLWEELKRLRERGGYPWTYLDKPPFDEATWKKYMEHVYEPINPPPLTSERNQSREELASVPASPPPPPPTTPTPSAVKGSSIPDAENRFDRIPAELDFSKKVDDLKRQPSEPKSVVGETEDMEGQQEESERSHRVEASEEFEPVTPSDSASKATSAAAESSGFKDLFVKHGNLGKTRREQMRAQAQEIQNKLRNHAGRIRTKLQSRQRPVLDSENLGEGGTEKSKFRLPEMHVPKINLPDRSKFKLPERTKFHLPDSAKLHLPDRTKFHLPERPKFNLSEKIHLPEKAKIHLPSTSKFHLPDKSKFHLPEAPKFHLPDKSKFHLPDTSKFHLPDTSKFHLPDTSKFHLPERPKIHLPDRAKFHLPDRSKFHLPDKAKFRLPERARLSHAKIQMPRFKRSKGLRSPSDSTPFTGKFDFKSYPKLFAKHAKDYMTSSPKQTRGRTPPPKMKELGTPPAGTSGKWLQKLDDMQYADEDDDENDPGKGGREVDSRKSESLFEYGEKDGGYDEEFEKRSERASMTRHGHPSQSFDRQSVNGRKQGVLEEINSDEYFLRQKGISQDDIDMGKYLSHEIREAFKSPGVNALAKMDYMDDENTEPRYPIKPARPTRTSSKKKKKSILKKSKTIDSSELEDGYQTYPPRRPGRKSRSQSKSLLNEEAMLAEAVTSYETAAQYDQDDVNMSRYDNVESDEEISEYYKTPGPVKEYEHYKVPRSHMPAPPSPPTKRKSSPENDDIVGGKFQETLQQFSAPENPPVPTARKKKHKKTDGLEVEESEQVSQQVHMESEEAVHPTVEIESPIPPKRTRSCGSRSLRSFVTEEEVNSSFRSEPAEGRFQEDSLLAQGQSQPEGDFPSHFLDTSPEESVFVKALEEQMAECGHVTRSAFELTSRQPNELEITDLDDPGFGYATVGKPTVVKPQRQKKKKKPERPPPPRRKKEVSVPIYNTYPRRMPVRPLRNYSTLGPSRPPRRSKTNLSVEEPIDKSFRVYSEIQRKPPREPREDKVEISESTKDLQTEEVIEKMKGRPLPPPPRPPRQKSKGPEDSEPTEEEQISLSILRDEEFPLERQVTAFVHQMPPADKEPVEEVSAATQTEVPPEDLSFETESSCGLIQEFSHEQLKIQQAFLEEMKREEEELRQRGETNESDLIDAELKAEVIRQIEDIIQEEKRILAGRKKEDSALESEPRLSETSSQPDQSQLMEESNQRCRTEETSMLGEDVVQEEHMFAEPDLRTTGLKDSDQSRQRDESAFSDRRSEEKKSERQYLDTDVDMGYASLDRRGHRTEQSGAFAEAPADLPPPLPPKMEKLQVGELEATSITVQEVKADQIFVKELQGNRVASHDIDNTGGTMALGNVNIPDSVIDQIVAKIPWDNLRPAQEANQSLPQARESSPRHLGPPVRPQRRQRGSIQPPQDDSDDENLFQPVQLKSHRRFHPLRREEDDISGEASSRATRGHEKKTVKTTGEPADDIPELSLQLARACTAAGVRAVKTFVEANAEFARTFDREMCVQVVLCIAIALVAAFFLFGFDAKIIHLHRWDFQFPPQPPNSAV